MKAICAALALLLAVPAGLAAPTEMQPGLWEITTTMEIQGMPQRMPAQKVRHCYTKKDIEEKNPTIPQSQDKNCQIKDYKVEDNMASWGMVCTGENAMSASGTMTIGATAFSGTMKSHSGEGGEAMDVTQTWSGKRVGDCK
jgi:uncharacterized protein DUF3617